VEDCPRCRLVVVEELWAVAEWVALRCLRVAEWAAEWGEHLRSNR
jgi:hypothetical protein